MLPNQKPTKRIEIRLVLTNYLTFLADLSVTSSRNQAVLFSMPWMNLGISIIFIKPRKAPPSLLSFLSPFTVEVWMYTAFGK